MAACLTAQSADGILLKTDRGFGLFAFGTAVPADNSTGYATGCLFLQIDGSAGTALYCNEGSETASDFDAVSVA